MSALIDQRLAFYETQIEVITEQVEAGSKQAGPIFVAGHALAIFGAAKTYLEENRHTLEGEARKTPRRTSNTSSEQIGTLGD